MSRCLRGLRKMDSMLLLCFVFLQQSLARSDSEFRWAQAVLVLPIQMPNIHCWFLCSWQKHEGLGGPTNHFVRALLKPALRAALELVFRVRAERPAFITVFGVPATFGLLWKVCGDPEARLWDNRTETTEMGFLSHRNKPPVPMCEYTDKAIPRAALKGIQMGIQISETQKSQTVEEETKKSEENLAQDRAYSCIESCWQKRELCIGHSILWNTSLKMTEDRQWARLHGHIRVKHYLDSSEMKYMCPESGHTCRL